MNIRIALAGNPNSGKTTLFNALTGSNQYTGNWPGVTVEKKEGKLKGYGKGETTVTVVDLPGIYSLSPYTLEEVVSRKYLLEEKPEYCGWYKSGTKPVSDNTAQGNRYSDGDSSQYDGPCQKK